MSSGKNMLVFLEMVWFSSMRVPHRPQHGKLRTCCQSSVGKRQTIRHTVQIGTKQCLTQNQVWVPHTNLSHLPLSLTKKLELFQSLPKVCSAQSSIKCFWLNSPSEKSCFMYFISSTDSISLIIICHLRTALIIQRWVLWIHLHLFEFPYDLFQNLLWKWTTI